ncbi:hypothetical protein N9D23_10100 [Rubripirellula sp.]|nr:hypothetical protein [Rubripirellula sp.]
MKMLPEYKTKTNMGIAIGLVLQMAGFALNGAFGSLLLFGGIGIFLWAVFATPKGKGSLDYGACSELQASWA